MNNTTVELNKVTADSYINGNEIIINEEVNTTTRESFDWSNLSYAEKEEDVSVDATEDIPSYAETAGNDQTNQKVKDNFLKDFPIGKVFVAKDSARAAIQKLGLECNVPFETGKSDSLYIRLICKPFGNYLSEKKNGAESKDSVISRPSRNTMRIGCEAFVYVRFSRDVRTYASNRKLNTHDQEYAIQILSDGSFLEGNEWKVDCKNPFPGIASMYCAKHFLLKGPDFAAQKMALEETVVEGGHIFELYPKYHCECNWIEMYWGGAKREARLHCDYTFKSLEAKIPRCMNYIDAYSRCSDGREVVSDVYKFVTKSYLYHRKVTYEDI
ncbi:hypothetical protein BD770DRAFT_443248 [Pilaira anomala]|nr:hypothetical protein BD770DRAFT_443248 [Pilaira anomala]